MAKSKTEKQKAKRKAKKKKIGQQMAFTQYRGVIYCEQAILFAKNGNLEKACINIKKAYKINPDDYETIMSLGYIGSASKDRQMEFDALKALKRIGRLSTDMWFDLLEFTASYSQYKEGSALAGEFLALLTGLEIKEKSTVKRELQEFKNYFDYQLHFGNAKKAEDILNKKKSGLPLAKALKKKVSGQQNTTPDLPMPVQQKVHQPEKTIQQIPIDFKLDMDSFYEPFLNPLSVGITKYDLTLLSHQIRFQESFENLICLTTLTNIRSLWYQEETARKVLKRFRGRALLSDEVGLGKTIEALIVFSEYIKRGMVKTGLILTPTPLVSQWKEELKSKFNIEVPSTDDPDFRQKGDAFWEAPFVLASINQAKSKKNYAMVTGKSYDMIIIDEAHHLKNRTTLNWKLVNDLKKRFILLLTATPVENNLMELYNLITLLKPGQLETASSFREKFMTKGDPTDPKNRSLLKELLSEVMIRNTRSLAGIKIPARFAETVRIPASKTDQQLYERLQLLARELNNGGKGQSIVTKNLLAQAGSSPTALEKTISKMLVNNLYLLKHEKELRAIKNLCHTNLDTPKNKALLKLVQTSREKIIVFVKYIGTLEHLTELFEWHGISFALFHGSMNNARKDQEIQAFSNEKQVLLTTEIGGEGRNLQFCSRMVNYDLPWNPMKIEQRIGRIHRIGQEKDVRIFNLCASGSVEDYILDILDRKINMFEMVIGEIDMIVGRIRGEQEFEDIIYDIWINAPSEAERKKAFDSLGTRMKRAKSGYEKTRELDDKLFGDMYEL
ncbi:MAG: DEAD/DEAH box helicase [Proteobacteria bacterium]|nr:DEAD/DEAH box helicase [Pseudomonadota bacterium]